MTPLLRLLAAFLLAALASACAPSFPDGPPQPTERDIVQLTIAINYLGPGIDPVEAARAARIAYLYPLQLAESYQITDAPIVHNRKVNRGLKPRGLCWHWATDMEARLAQENFRTLDLHRAIANADAAFRLEHSTVIVSAKGRGMYDGIVLDPWRRGGALFWSRTTEDRWYDWKPRAQVLADKRAARGLDPRLPPAVAATPSR
ncbi:hypothetical protein [Litorisediminicola beolgyonensis]|uniref:Lipoprotein n=1 Tax=Litorisediminicola beolgyonensis TaxID=1173614 RepID=A0ABW3ZNQ7_9RHOB